MTAEAKNTAPAPKKEIDVKAIITVTARLAQLLAEEVDLLTDMKVSKIEALQQEKLFLANALESQRKLLDKHPELTQTIPSQDRKDLQEVVEVFNAILEENHRKLLLAREVNHKIVQAITSVVREGTLSQSYNDSGSTDAAAFATLSVTLNQTI